MLLLGLASSAAALPLPAAAAALLLPAWLQADKALCRAAPLPTLRSPAPALLLLLLVPAPPGLGATSAHSPCEMLRLVTLLPLPPPGALAAV